MDQHYFLVCPVNSQNEEKLAGQGEARLSLLTNATYPHPSGGHASVHSVSDCQRHTLQYRTCGEPSLFDLTKRRRAKRKVQQYEQYYYQNHMVERMYSYFILIYDKVHIYSGEGRKTTAQKYSTVVVPSSSTSRRGEEPSATRTLVWQFHVQGRQQ